MLIGLKPMTDLRRLLKGHEIRGASFSTLNERRVCRIIEACTLSVPSSILQIMALLVLESWHLGLKALFASVLIAWVNTAHKAVWMNSENHSQIETQSFVAADMQNATNAFLFILSLSHVISRSSSLALLCLTDRIWLASFMSVDMGVYLLYTIVRRDFICWPRGAGFGTYAPGVLKGY